MDYLLEGVGNELLAITILIYVILISFFFRFFKFDSYVTVTESISRLWQYCRAFFVRDDMSAFPNREMENESDNPAFDVRIFNTDCCVCFEDCNRPVTSVCGHCFCGACALNLIEHSSVPLKCPLCRQEDKEDTEILVNKVRIVIKADALFDGLKSVLISELMMLIATSYYLFMCRVLFLPFREQQNTDDSLYDLVASSVTSYNSRVEHRFPFVNRVRNAPVMLRHLMRSFISFHGHLIFRLKCHVVAAVFMAGCYLALSTDIIPERVFGLIGFIDDFIVLTFITVYLARQYTSIDSSVTFEDIRAALEYFGELDFDFSWNTRVSIRHLLMSVICLLLPVSLWDLRCAPYNELLLPQAVSQMIAFARKHIVDEHVGFEKKH